MRVRGKVSAVMAVALCGAVAAPAVADERGFITAIKAYAEPVGSAVEREYQVRPLLSVGDRVPETSGGDREYQMVGIPDGLGLRPRDDGQSDLFMNHELGNTVESEPTVGEPRNRGAFVSRYRLAKDGSVVTGERAYDTVFEENARVGPAAQVDNGTPGFGRFCSGFLAGPDVGFSDYIYLTGEESTGDLDEPMGTSGTFDRAGGQSVAVYDNEVHTLPKLGRFAKENAVVRDGYGDKTVVFPTEDGPSSPDSQLWMYVGEKRSGGSKLSRNGLDNGKLLVFVADDEEQRTEADFQQGDLSGHWEEIPDAENLSERQLEAAADEKGAFGFIRPEDAAASKGSSKDLFFVTTGGAAGNMLGRGYRLRLDEDDPTGPADLEVIYNADQIEEDGGDTAFSPDNIDVSERFLMVQEDGTTQSRPVIAGKERDGSIWRFDLKEDFERERVVELNPPGRDGTPVPPAVWETSGIIDAGERFGDDTWLFDTQAHPPTQEPVPGTVEDGQLLLMSGLSGGDDGGSSGGGGSGGGGNDGDHKGGKKGNGGNGGGNGKRDDDDGDGGDPPASGGVLGAFFRNDCGTFRRNFNTAPKQTRCVEATRLVLTGLTPPAQACQRFSRRRARGFKRSDHAACLRAVQLARSAVLRMFPR